MKGNRIQGTLRSYLRWPLMLTPLLLAMNVHIYFLDVKAGAVMTIYVLLYTIIAFLLLYFKREQLLKDIVTYAIRFNNTTKRLANDLDIPVLIADYAGNCLWFNKSFQRQFCNEGVSRKFAVDSVIPNLTVETYPKTYEQNSEIHFHNEDVFYKAVIQKVNVDKVTEENGKKAETMGLGDNFYVFFIYDETEIVHTDGIGLCARMHSGA